MYCVSDLSTLSAELKKCVQQWTAKLFHPGQSATQDQNRWSGASRSLLHSMGHAKIILLKSRTTGIKHKLWIVPYQTTSTSASKSEERLA